MDKARLENLGDVAVCFALYSTMNETLRLYRDLLEPWGLTYQQVLVLSTLWSGGELTPGRIADQLMLDSSTVAGLLKRLERDGLLHREVDLRDRRRVIIKPTPRAKEIFAELGLLGECIQQAMSLTPEQTTQVLSLLRQLRTSMREYPRPEISHSETVSNLTRSEQ